VILQTWLCAVRDRLVATLLLALVATTALSAFLGDQSLLERSETAMAFIAFSARLIVALGMGLFAIVLTQRSFESGETVLLFSRPLSRPAYVLSLFAGLIAVAFLLVVASVLALRLAANLPLPALLEWGGGLLLETGILLAFALFAGLGLQTIVGAFALTLCFYLLARLAGAISSIAGSEFHNQAGLADSLLGKFAACLTLVLPRLDLYNADWLVHAPSHPLALALQMTVYIALLLGCAGFDLQRRQL
jgi:hypothetical protein